MCRIIATILCLIFASYGFAIVMAKKTVDHIETEEIDHAKH